jgi:NDP-sugar pyrophosphorylase family protein
MICYPLHWLRSGGISEAVICANSGTSAVRQYLGDGSRMAMDFKYLEDEIPRGPAGCARDAARLSDASVFVVVEGALIPSLDLRALIESHRRSGAAVTVVTEIDRRRHPAGAQRPCLSGGIYVFEKRVLEHVSTRGYQDIKEGLLPSLYSRGERVLTHEVQGLSPRVLDYPTYAGVSRWLIGLALEQSAFLAHYRKIGDRLQHPDALVDPNARFIGPVIVGRNAEIGAGAFVVGPSTIGAYSKVASGALVCRSLIWEHVSVGAAAAVDCSLLANHSVVRDGDRVYASVQIPGIGETTFGRHSLEFAGSAAARINFLSSIRRSSAFVGASVDPVVLRA